MKENCTCPYEGNDEICAECHHHTALVESMRKQMPTAEELERTAELFKVFGDPTRMQILTALFAQEMCVCDISDLLGMTQSSISHQLRLLRNSRLVKNRREGKSVYYSLDDAHVATIIAQGLEHIRHGQDNNGTRKEL